MTRPARKPLQLAVDHQDDAAVVTVSGSVSIAQAEQLRDTMEQLASGRVPVIVLDLSEMDFICSLGLGAIISGHLRCRHHAGQIKLVNPSNQVRQLLETTRLTKLFGVYESVSDALARA